MKLEIDNEVHNFIPIQTFRAQWGLPKRFAVANFEPKNWTGLGSLEGSGALLSTVRQRVLEAIPSQISGSDLIGAVDELSTRFQQELEAANLEIGLRLNEIDFAVAGFRDVLQSAAYQLIQMSYRSRDKRSQEGRAFDFSTIYQSWLNESTRISTTTYTYTQNQTHFEIRVVNNAYGRIGLQVRIVDELVYVLDTELACPASGYMYDLCNNVAQELCRSMFVFGQD